MTNKPYLYHVTELKNFNSIMSKGLIPGHKKSNLIGGAKEDYNQVIWLDSSPTIWLWAKYAFKGKNWILLRVTTKYLDQKLINKSISSSYGTFYYYRGIILAKAITRLSVKLVADGMAVTGYYKKVKQ
jgi:hypothetical protein